MHTAPHIAWNIIEGINFILDTLIIMYTNVLDYLRTS